MIHSTATPGLILREFKIYERFLDVESQRAMVDDLREVARRAPFFSPQTPYGKPMSVRMTSAGDYGWLSDTQGYRYAPTHPNGTPWPCLLYTSPSPRD